MAPPPSNRAVIAFSEQQPGGTGLFGLRVNATFLLAAWLLLDTRLHLLREALDLASFLSFLLSSL